MITDEIRSLVAAFADLKAQRPRTREARHALLEEADRLNRRADELLHELFTGVPPDPRIWRHPRSPLGPTWGGDLGS